MSLFREYELTASIYLPSDSDSTKKTEYPASPNFTVKMNLIRISAEDGLIEGEELGEYRADIDGTNAGLITQGAKVTVGGFDYVVVNQPRYNKLFNHYKLNLKPV